MVDMEFLKPLLAPNNNKMVLLVMDGVGGLPDQSGKTELETAQHPNLDRLAKEGILGVSDPVAPGITPGSGPAHLALFGYDPVKYEIGRGVLEVMGMGMPMTDKDVALRANYASMDKDNKITDRRAGRISSERNQQLCQKLKTIGKIEDVEVMVEAGKEHRFVVILRGEGLSDKVAETDPQATGVCAIPPKALNHEGEKTSRILTQFIQQANKLLASEFPANTFLMRGVSTFPRLPRMNNAFGIKSAAIANYPMYRGLAKIVGMDILATGDTIESEFTTLEKHWANYDFFYVHIKKTDSYGEDGKFKEKVHIIEELDGQIPRLIKLGPSVIVVTGDHCTPSVLQNHSWHPSPLMLWAPKTCLVDDATQFGERACMKGGLGRINHLNIIPLMLAHALRFIKYGA